MEATAGAPRSRPDWGCSNPLRAAREFVERTPDFAIAEPPIPFNEDNIRHRVTYWPSSCVRR